MDIDVAQARRLADLINTSVSQLEDISSSAEKGKGEGRHVQTIVIAATQLVALVRPPAQVLLELATGVRPLRVCTRTIASLPLYFP